MYSQDKADPLSKQHEPVYLTALSAAKVAGITRPTAIKRLQPVAWYLSTKHDKLYPLYDRPSAEAYRAQLAAGGAE